MAKYKLIDGTGYSYYKEGEVYDGDYTALKFGKLVKEMAAEKPKQWQLVSDTPDRLDQLIEKWEKILPAYEEETKLNPDNKIYSCVRLIKAFVTDLKSLKV